MVDELNRETIIKDIEEIQTYILEMHEPMKKAFDKFAEIKRRVKDE